jgi:hypothetical protein
MSASVTKRRAAKAANNNNRTMKAQKVSVCGIEGSFLVPETHDELVTIAPSADTLLRRVIQQVLAHQLYGDLRSGLVEFVEEKKNFSRRRHIEKDDEGKDVTIIDESRQEPFLDRAVAESAVTKAELIAEVQRMCDDSDYGFAKYLTSERRHAAPRKLSKEIETKVAKYIADGVADVVAYKLSTKLGREVTSEPLVLGNAIRDFERQAQEAALVAARAAMEL